MKPNIFLTSDLHFGHVNIIKYCDRPWNNVDEMERGLINNWNSVVKNDNDIVYMLGDFAMGGNLPYRVPMLLSRLRGIKHLIAGNHDPKATTSLDVGWRTVTHGGMNIIHDNVQIHMRHYNPQKPGDWPDSELGVLLFHGHSHGKPGHHNYRTGKNYVDVGVDAWNYYPITIERAIEAAKQ